MIYSIGGCYRQPIWCNWPLCGAWLVFASFFGFLVVFPVYDSVVRVRHLTFFSSDVARNLTENLH